MGIRDTARQAYLQSQNNVVDDAKNALLSTLAPLNIGLITTDIIIKDNYSMVVFTDDIEDVYLAATKTGQLDWEVYLVKYEDNRWVTIDKVESLPQLGEILDPVPSGELPAAWVSGNVYPMGALVTHNGNTWESTVDNNVWEPGVAHSVWVIV